MNLAWLVAVLRPHDLMPSGLFPDPQYSAQGPVRLAAIVTGEHGKLRKRVEAHAVVVDWDADRGLVNAELSLHAGSTMTGLLGLRDELDGESDDVARACALGLIACCVAAELDDYATIDTIVATLLSRLPTSSDEGRLLRAAVLQQQSLRLRDIGAPQPNLSAEVAQLLDAVNLHRCPAFEIRADAPGDWHQSLSHVSAALRDAARSLMPRFPNALQDPKTAAELMPLIDAPDQRLRIELERARTYRRYMDSVYRRVLGSTDRSLVVAAPPDLFTAVLSLELLGHVSATEARKDLAVMRLVQALEGSGADPSDALRLLRHAEAEAELDLALDYLQAAGPLTVLGDDARQIIANRNQQRYLRDGELKVLAAATDLLTPGEADQVLSTVLDVAAAGGPPSRPGRYRLPSNKAEAALRAASRLASAAGDPTRAAALLLKTARAGSADDPGLDLVLARALTEVDWAAVDPDVKEGWREWCSSAQHVMTVTVDVLDEHLGRPIGAPRPLRTLADAAARLNGILRGEAINDAESLTAAGLARDAMAAVREEAAAGRYTFRAVSEADVAAGLILYAGRDELWVELTDFLLDPHVYRDSKTSALERLAREHPDLPQAVSERLRSKIRELLRMPPAPPTETLTPYPSALRLAAVYGFVDQTAVVTAIAALAGSTVPVARAEAARCVAALAKRQPELWLLSLAVQLAQDSEITVKTYAGSALALLGRDGTPFEAVAAEQLERLLNQDGVLVPLIALREIAAAGSIPRLLTGQIEQLGKTHPSRSVRSQATSLLTLLGGD